MPAASFAPVTVKELLAAFPEFADVAASAIKFQLALQNTKQDKGEWGGYWRFAVILATAHELGLKYDLSSGLAATGKKDPTQIGIVTSSSANPSGLSESKTLPAWMTGDDLLDSYYGRTEYGQQYLTLLIEVIPAGNVVSSPPVTPPQMRGPGRRSVTV